MIEQALHGAPVLGIQLDGPERVWGYAGSSLSLPVLDSAGCASLWLKLRSRPTDEPTPAHWSGVATAERVVTGLPILRPTLHATHAWTCDGYAYQAEVATRMPVRSLSRTRQAPAQVVDLPAAWWADLRATLDRIVGADRTGLAPVSWKEAAARAAEATVEPSSWVPSHGDLCWANLGAGEGRAVLFDWDYVGLGPRHADAAGLFLTSLDRPDAAARVRDHFGDQLDSPAGLYAQLVIGTHWTTRFRDGEHIDLAPALLAHMATVRERLSLPGTGSRP
jgi:hypothetical protein